MLHCTALRPQIYLCWDMHAWHDTPSPYTAREACNFM